jgi:hypothetical protein
MTDSPQAYPSSWKPKGAPAFDEREPEPQLEPLGMELAAAAMTDDEFDAFTRRVRGYRRDR